MRRLRRIVFTWMATARGGAEKSSLELCRAIRHRYRLEVVLIAWHYGATREGGGYLDAAPNEALDCFDAAHYRALLAESLAADPDATVLISNHRTYQIDLCVAAAAGVPACVLFRESPFAEEVLRTLPDANATKLVYCHGGELGWPQLSKAAALIGISDFGARQLARFAAPGARIVRIYNGPAAPCADADLEPLRPVRRFVTASRLINWKVIDFGITAFARLCAARTDVHLQIAGDGPEETHLRRLVTRLELDERVEFLGYRADMARVYQANDCLLHLSAIESFGRVIIEANHCGLPAIVPQSAGAGELVVNGHTGLTFRPGDLDDCVRALTEACGWRAAQRAQFGQAARTRAQALFNLDRVVEEYVGLANGVLLADDT